MDAFLDELAKAVISSWHSIGGWLASTNVNLATWLQAFAAVVALIISGVAVVRTDATARRTQKLQRQSISVVIHMDMLRTRELIKMTRGQLQTYVKNKSTVPGQGMGAFIQQEKIALFPMLERNIENLYLLGNRIGPMSLQFVSLIFQYNDFVDTVVGRAMMLGPNEWTTAIDQIYPQLDLLEGVADTVIHYIEKDYPMLVPPKTERQISN